MDIDGKKLELKPIPKLKELKRVAARKSCLTTQIHIENTSSNIMRKIESTSDFKIDEMEVAGDHLHLMISSNPSLSPRQIVRKLKQESIVHMWKLFPKELQKNF